MKIWLIALSVLLLPSLCTANSSTGIVSLDLCSDWMLLKYADPGSVRALSPLSNQHPLEGVTHALPVHDGSLEHIMSLKPEIVITGEFNAVILRKRLQKLGINVEVLALPQTLGQVEDYEKAFLTIIGQPLTKASMPEKPLHNGSTESPRLLLLGANAGAAGSGTLEEEIIKQAGWQNYVEQPGYITLDMESLVADPPDMILWSAPKARALANRFLEHPALRKAIPEENRSITNFGDWQCQGPWTWQRIQQLQQARQQWHAR